MQGWWLEQAKMNASSLDGLKVAERAQRILERDDAIQIIANTYLSEIECNENGIWKIGLSDFIELCTGITGSRWRLPNCEISDGWVTLHDEGDRYSSRAKVARLLRERMKEIRHQKRCAGKNGENG